ncbi:MAG: pyruvate dehydrogenase (acetyl-transferring) E1 component subunit alpha [Candidatus Diapherotrites archaeon]
MPLKKLAVFSIERLGILNEKGECDEKLKPKLSEEKVKEMHRLMVLARAFDEKALSLQRQGRIGTYASVKGQEAAQIGSALALGKKDWVVQSFRENSVSLALGYPLHLLYAYWGGDERGAVCPENINVLPTSIPVGSQIIHGAGIGWAMKMRKEKAAAITFFGDGATSEGDFHEGLNFAGVFKTNSVFLCQNNQWAISEPRKKQTESKTIAQKAIAYGIKGIQVDGNDVFAVFKAVSEALENARQGKGATLIEAETYRIGDHTTADDAKRYRPEKEVKEWEKKDPIERLRKYLEKKKLWSEKEEKKLKAWAAKKVEEAVQQFEAMPAQKPTEFFDFTFSELTPRLAEQKKELMERIEEKERVKEDG